jgi:hypothetical protein
MKVELKRIPAQIPALDVPDWFLEKVGKIAEGAILYNIKHQLRADGGTLQQNKKVTRDRKRKLGRPQLSLVDQFHRFTRGRGQSWATQVDARRKWVIVEPATRELAKLVEYVQKGGKGRHKYLGWFGLNQHALDAIRTQIRDWIRGEFEKARKKQRGT